MRTAVQLIKFTFRGILSAYTCQGQMFARLKRPKGRFLQLTSLPKLLIKINRGSPKNITKIQSHNRDHIFQLSVPRSTLPYSNTPNSANVLTHRQCASKMRHLNLKTVYFENYILEIVIIGWLHLFRTDELRHQPRIYQFCEELNVQAESLGKQKFVSSWRIQ